jgi:hypothetical protein
LINFSLGGDFGFASEWSTDGKSEGFLGGYDVFSSILPTKALSLTLFSTWNRDVQSLVRAGRNNIQTFNWGGTLYLKKVYIPSTLDFRKEFIDNKSRSSGITTRQKEDRTILTYTGQRGWIDSEMELSYQFTDEQDEINQDNDVQSHVANLYYSLDFGPELNRRWDSRTRFLRRTGNRNITTWDVSESLRMDHTDRFKTTYQYIFNGSDIDEQDLNLSHGVVFGLSHQLFKSLTTTFRLNNRYETFEGGRSEEFDSNLNFAYTKRIPGEGLLNIGLGGGFSYSDSKFGSGDKFVLQEPHTASTPFTSPIALNNPSVIIASVVVTKVALGPGPLPGGCSSSLPQTLLVGDDYTLQTVGNITEIVPIDCTASPTGKGINAGDKIEVDYRFETPDILTLISKSWHLSISTDYRWIRPYFIHTQTDDDLLKGEDKNFLNDEHSDTLGIELHYSGQHWRSKFGGEGQMYKSRRTEYKRLRFNQLLNATLSQKLRLSLNSNQELASFSKPKRETQFVNSHANLDYRAHARLSANFRASFGLMNQTDGDDERRAEGRLEIRWRYRKLLGGEERRLLKNSRLV